MFTNKTSLIIPTKNRSDEIIKLIHRLNNLNINFQDFLVIDSSDIEHSIKISAECKKQNIKYFKTKPSTSFQRNFGLSKVGNSEYVMFMDDDVILLDDTFLKMDTCIEKLKEKNISGFGFNQIENRKKNIIENFKSSKLFGFFNIYPSEPGKIAKSGWQSKILDLKEDIWADWLFTTICIYRYSDIKNLNFDESFGIYSYLEDLDFSLNLKYLNKKIYISSEAKFFHPINIDRSSFQFGITEVRNRYKIVKKYKLSLQLFIAGLLIRFLISFLKSLAFNKKYFLRCVGNIYCIFTRQWKK